ncbi:hypothetical protein [Shewanella pneumatophori]|uniref:Uncharacterized protein n=1 Tax=Shewanella pneumatophori TaxID=314092 RepID=A0A9X2CGE0_9GAMM|nr:hypothetical protein [Shewanella pneumatophori]MCL1140882.1 hypothetical protein [Shewanella pneumatophori]
MLNANSCGLCGRVIAPRELFSHLVIDHGWKKVSENINLVGGPSKKGLDVKKQTNPPCDSFELNNSTEVLSKLQGLVNVRLFQLEDNWHVTTKKGVFIASFPSEMSAESWLNSYADKRNKEFNINKIAPSVCAGGLHGALNVRLKKKGRKLNPLFVSKFTKSGPVFCSQCGGDGGAGGRCWKCNGTGWAK